MKHLNLGLLVRNTRLDGWMDGSVDEWVGGWMDLWTDGRMGGLMDDSAPFQQLHVMKVNPRQTVECELDYF